MECLLFDKTVFGPVLSRRLGSSLGINLLPTDAKVCNFDCVYCECGPTDLKTIAKAKFPSVNEVRERLAEALKELQLTHRLPDSITFAGNGEPTLHPKFPEIMNAVIELRNQYAPASKISVFSNGTLLNKKEIVLALKKADNIILKLDAGRESEFVAIDRPLVRRSLQWIKNHLRYFNTHLIIQSMFVKGVHKGQIIDNTNEENVNEWLECLRELKPELVMIYSIDRPTALEGLEKVPPETLEAIARRVENAGIKTQVN